MQGVGYNIETITVNGLCAGGKGGGRWGKTSVQTLSNRFWKTLTKGAVLHIREAERQLC